MDTESSANSSSHIILLRQERFHQESMLSRIQLLQTTPIRPSLEAIPIIGWISTLPLMELNSSLDSVTPPTRRTVWVVGPRVTSAVSLVRPWARRRRRKSGMGLIRFWVAQVKRFDPCFRHLPSHESEEFHGFHMFSPIQYQPKPRQNFDPRIGLADPALPKAARDVCKDFMDSSNLLVFQPPI